MKQEESNPSVLFSHILKEAKLSEIATRYKETVAKGTEALKEAKRLHDELEKYYIQAVNFDLIQAIYLQLKHNIEGLAKQH